METIKTEIIKYLEERGTWIMGGTLEREVGASMEVKNSNVGRRCRELVEAGTIERGLIQIDGKGPNCVRYRVIREASIQYKASSIDKACAIEFKKLVEQSKLNL